MKSSIWILLCMGLLVTACNEEVSPDLDAASASTGDADGVATIPPDEYIFKVENTSASILNYNLHRTGSGNSYTACKISSSAALTSADYEAEGIVPRLHDTKVYDYSCFFEAEELHLYYSGLSFAVTASKNTCEYVGYAPFSYYSYMPGNSTKAVRSKFTATPGADCDVVTAVNGVNYGCGTLERLMVDTSGTVTAPVAFSESNGCQFDYTASGGPNCDPGVITSSDYVYTLQDDGSTVVTITPNVKKYCGGAISNCIAGPITKVAALAGQTQGMEMTRTTKNADYTQEYSFDGGIGAYDLGNFKVANFRRELASKTIDFVDSTIDYDEPSDVFTLGASFDNTAYAGIKSFDPRTMELYSTGKDGTGAANAPLATALALAKVAPGFRAEPYAAEPFLGTKAQYRTNPFYTFFCLDGALEVKARIRIVVRDWDRVFYPDPTQTLDKFALISDIDQADTISRIDNPTGSESDIDANTYNRYNDLPDWDDYVFMERDDATQVWNPANGYFSLSNFLGE